MKLITEAKFRNGNFWYLVSMIGILTRGYKDNPQRNPPSSTETFFPHLVTTGPSTKGRKIEHLEK